MKKKTLMISLLIGITIVFIITICLISLLFKPIKVESTYKVFNTSSMTTTQYKFHLNGTYTQEVVYPISNPNEKPLKKEYKGTYVIKDDEVILSTGEVFDESKYEVSGNLIAWLIPLNCIIISAGIAIALKNKNIFKDKE